MKLKSFILSLAAFSAIFASAQSQGHKDGIEYYKIDQLENAKEILTKNLPADGPDRAEALYYLGAISLKEGKVDEALKNFNEGIALDPKNGFNFVGLGAVDLKKGDAKAAAEHFKQATKAQNKAFIHVAVARAYYDADPVAYAKEYEKYMDSARKKNMKDPSIYVMAGDVLRDQALASGVDDGNTIGNAASEYEQAIYFDENSPEAYVKYSRLYAHINPDYAINRLIELNKIAPNSAMAQRELAERYYDNDQWTRAAQQYGKYIENPNHFVKDEERYAVLLYFGNRFDESLEVAKRILNQEPNSAQMRRMLFLNLEKKGDLAGARAAAEEFFKMPGISFTANDYTTYAGIVNALEDYDAEIQAREKARTVNTEKVELIKDLATAYNQAGSRANKAGDIETANAHFIKAKDTLAEYIAANPDSDINDLVALSKRWQNIALTSPEESPEREAAINGALEVADQIIERAPEDVNAHCNKAIFTIIKNNNRPSEETVAVYTKVLELADADPDGKTKYATAYNDAYTRIAGYYIGQGDKATAKEWYIKLLELNPDNEELKKYIDNLK